MHKNLTLSQILADRGYGTRAIEGELKRLSMVLKGSRPLTILSQPTIQWARDRGKL